MCRDLSTKTKMSLAAVLV